MKSSSFPFPHVLAGFAAGVLAGFLAGYAFKSRPVASVPSPSAALVTAEHSGPGTPASSVVPSVTLSGALVTLDELLAIETQGASDDPGDTARERRKLDLLDRVRQQDIAALLNEMMRRPRQEEHESIRYRLLAMLTQQNPKKALALVESMRRGEHRNDMLQSVLDNLADQNPEAVFQWTRDNKDNPIADRVMLDAYRSFAKKDPESAISQYLAKDASRVAYDRNTSGDDGALPYMFRDWAQTDPVAAARRASALPEGDEKNHILSLIGSQWAEKDPAAAWRWAAALPDNFNSDNKDAKSGVLSAWARKDPVAALAEATRISSFTNRQTIVTDIMSEWSGKDFNAALAWTTSLGDTALQSEVLGRLAAHSERKTGDLSRLFDTIVSSMPPGPAYSTALSSLFHNWSDKDPQAAAQAILQLPPSESSNEAVRNTLANWARKDPSAALAWAKQLPEDRGRSSAIGQSVFWLAKTDLKSAIAIVTDLPAGDAQNWAQKNLLDVWAAKSPNDALAWAQNLPDPKARDSAILSVAESWASEDSASAAAWALSQPESPARQGAARHIVSAWAQKDSVAAADWLKKLPSGATRDAALSAFAPVLQGDDPATALAWAGQITDPQKRLAQMQKMAADWLKSSPAAARQWITTQSNFPQETKDHLLKASD